MDDAESSFADVVANLKGLGQSRDPRSRRVGALASALEDVIEGEVTPGKLYASVISTLEGTLHQRVMMHDDVDVDDVDVDSVADSLSTQSALLKIVSVVVPHVSSPALLGATVDASSRALRGAVASCQSVLAGETDGAQLLDTADGLGGIGSVLCAACAAASEVLRGLPSTAEERVVRQLVNSTLIDLLHDPRSKVQNAAKEALCGLLQMRSPRCHPSVLKATTRYVNDQIEAYLQNPSQNRGMIDLLGLLSDSLATMDFTSVAGSLMTILMDLLNDESMAPAAAPVFVAKSHKETSKILTINSILSAMLSLLEAESDSLEGNAVAELNTLAVRVLASLVQARGSLTFRDGAAEDDLLQSGRMIYGQVILSASQRIMMADAGSVEVGAKLLPLAMQQVLNLSRPLQNDASNNNGVAETLSAEVSHLLRVQMSEAAHNFPTVRDACLRDCLRVMMTVLETPFEESQSPFLQSIPLLLQQMNCEDELARECIRSIVLLRCDPTTEPGLRRSLEGTLGSSIEGVGLEQFWRMVNIPDLLASGQSATKAPANEYVWIIDAMKASGSVTSTPLHLAFFHDQILPLARHFDALAAKHPTGADSLRVFVTKLWGLLPVFCQRPADLDEAFPKLAPILVKAMSDRTYPDLIVSNMYGLRCVFEFLSAKICSSRGTVIAILYRMSSPTGSTFWQRASRVV
jgi:NUC173 domain